MPKRPNLRPTYIYWIFDTRTGIPIYCGKTVQKVEYRLTGHIDQAKYYPKRPLYAHLLVSQEVRIEIVDVIPVGFDWAAAETAWVTKLRVINPKCLNVSNGGDGAPGHIKSEKSKALMAAKMRGRKFSPETIAKMSASKMGNSMRKGKKLSPEQSRQASLQRTGRKLGPHSQDARDRIAASNRGQKRSPEAIAAMRAGWAIRRLTPVSAETRAKLSAAGKRRFAQIPPPPY